MSDMEKMIWTAAFAAEWARTRAFYHSSGVSRLSIESISGFACAEVADVALGHYREALTGSDSEYLTPVKENWT